MKLSFRIALSLLVLALAMPLAAQEKVLTIGVDQEAIGLDPHIITAFSSHRRVDLLYNKLVRHDENLKIVPDLAESWEVPNNTTYIFNLRKGVKFHTGQEMTSDDVIFSLNRILDPKTASPGRSYITSIKTMEALDKYRVKITLSAPLASFL